MKTFVFAGTVAAALGLVMLGLPSRAHLNPAVILAAAGGDGVSAGEFIVDPPTLINLGFEWFIQGDDNRNAAVDVSYRKVGTAEWKQGLPLLRLHGEHIKQGDSLDVIAPNMFA